MMAQPKSSTIRAIVCINAISPPYMPISFPTEIMIPAAGITAMTTINAFPSFCQKSNEIAFFKIIHSFLSLFL